MNPVVQRSPTAAARRKILRLMSALRWPLTGGEILGYAATGLSADGVKTVMGALVADGLVVVSEAYHPNARGRRSRCYQLASLAGAKGGVP